MKISNKSQALVKIEKAELHQLCTQIKESLASNADFASGKQVFGLADLWNIHRSTRNRARRRTLND